MMATATTTLDPYGAAAVVERCGGLRARRIGTRLFEWRDETVDLAQAAESERNRVRATLAPTEIDGWLLLYSTLLLVALSYLGIVIYLFVVGRYSLAMYTYWSFTLTGGFYALLLVALWLEGRFLALVLLFYLPVVLGSTFNVAVLIVIAIQQNGDIFLSSITEGVTVAEVHTGDFALHSAPLLSLLFLLLVGLQRYASALLCATLASWRSSNARWLYALYFVLVPLVPMALYSLIFDPAVQYPTGIPTYVLWLLLVLINVVWMYLMYKSFTANYHILVKVSVPVAAAAAADAGLLGESAAAAAAAGATSAAATIPSVTTGSRRRSGGETATTAAVAAEKVNPLLSLPAPFGGGAPSASLLLTASATTSRRQRNSSFNTGNLPESQQQQPQQLLFLSSSSLPPSPSPQVSYDLVVRPGGPLPQGLSYYHHNHQSPQGVFSGAMGSSPEKIQLDL